jgi:1-acyl-sn-glycerol-3-phosphate acyltransferase
VTGRKALRSLFAWLYAAFLMALYVAFAAAAAMFVGGSRAFWLLAPKYFFSAAKAFGIAPALEGWDGLPESIRNGRQPTIFIANHASLFDPPLIIAALPCRPIFIAKKGLAWVPVLGQAMMLAGFIFVDRRKVAKSAASLKAAAHKIRQGRSVAYFPEGTRTMTGRLRTFKKGAFALAMESEAPIVPLAIIGGHRLLPKGEWRICPGEYRMTAGKPLWPSDYPDADALRRHAETLMREMLVDPIPSRAGSA